MANQPKPPTCWICHKTEEQSRGQTQVHICDYPDGHPIKERLMLIRKKDQKQASSEVKPEDTERLDVAHEILYEKRSQVCFKTGKEEQEHNENRVYAILSRRDELMKKRGAVEGLRRFEFSMAGEYGEWWTNTDAPRHIRETIKELEREIKEMEGK